MQQFTVIKENTDLEVDFYHGTKLGTIDKKKVDDWDASVWEHETKKNQVNFLSLKLFILIKRFINKLCRVFM